MTAGVIAIFIPPAFTSVREAIDWSRQRRLRQRWWRSRRYPPVDPTGDADADSFLAAMFAVLIALDEERRDKAEVMRVLCVAEDAVLRWRDQAILAARSFDDSDARSWDLAAGVVRKWVSDLA